MVVVAVLLMKTLLDLAMVMQVQEAMVVQVVFKEEQDLLIRQQVHLVIVAG